MGESNTSPRRVSSRFRRERALALRIAGLTYERIAASPTDPENGNDKPLYSSRQRAHDAVDTALREQAKSSAGKSKELRALELARLDAMQVSLWPLTRPVRKVECEECGHVLWREPDQGAVDRVVRIMERRSKYEGLDATDANDERMVGLLEQQVSLAQRAMVEAMEGAGIPAATQREVLERAAAWLRDHEEDDEG